MICNGNFLRSPAGPVFVVICGADVEMFERVKGCLWRHNSTQLNWPSWTAYSQVSRVFVYDVTTYKLIQLLFTLSSWVQFSSVELCRYKRALTYAHKQPTCTDDGAACAMYADWHRVCVVHSQSTERGRHSQHSRRGRQTRQDHLENRNSRRLSQVCRHAAPSARLIVHNSLINYN